MSYTEVHYAVQTKHTKLLTKLIADGKDVDIKDLRQNTPLHIAAQHGSTIKVLKLLLENGANVNAQNDKQQTPLHLAVRAIVEVVKVLLEPRADIEAKSKFGVTVLCNAVRKWKHVRIAKFLIEHGANVNAKDHRRLTPLHFASWGESSLEMVRLLIQLGADINARDAEGKTPFHSACAKANSETIKLMIENGADVNDKNSQGRTPLHFAADNNIEAARLLISHGAELNAKDNSGLTAHLVAWMYGNLRMFNFLQKNGANFMADYDFAENKVPLHNGIRSPYNAQVTRLLCDVDELNSVKEHPVCAVTFWGGLENRISRQNVANVRFNPGLIDKLYYLSEDDFDMLEAIDVVRKHLVQLGMINLAANKIFAHPKSQEGEKAKQNVKTAEHQVENV